MKLHAVIGLGFGDEGKGLVTDWLCSTLDATPEKILVIRHSGGHQAAHTVKLKTEGITHVFSTFGSGTLRGCPTYWSRYCTVDPISIIREAKKLADLGYPPILFLNPESPVTTPYDRFANQQSQDMIDNGTCGHGVGTTWHREENFYRLQVKDLYYPAVFSRKLDAVRAYYGHPALESHGEFIIACKQLINHDSITVQDERIFLESYHHGVFEGSQGLLLDQNFGFFPHVTRANTGIHNIREMLGTKPSEIYMVTRAYLTRHGKGPMVNEHYHDQIPDNLHETNTDNSFQGHLRKGLLETDLLRYAVESDQYLRRTAKKHVVVTCTDVLNNDYRYTASGSEHRSDSLPEFLKQIGSAVKADTIYYSDGPYSESIKKLLYRAG
jgi:adenylosuccinate synthase